MWHVPPIVRSKCLFPNSLGGVDSSVSLLWSRLFAVG